MIEDEDHVRCPVQSEVLEQLPLVAEKVDPKESVITGVVDSENINTSETQMGENDQVIPATGSVTPVLRRSSRNRREPAKFEDFVQF